VPNGFNKTFATGAHFYAQRHHPQCIRKSGCAGKANEFESSGNSILMDGLHLENVLLDSHKMNGKYFFPQGMLYTNLFFPSALLNIKVVTLTKKEGVEKVSRNIIKLLYLDLSIE
jgi:hypothetical protein